MKPLWPAEGRGPEPGLPLRSPGQPVGQTGLVRVSVGAGGRTEASRPWGLGYQSTAPSRFP